MRNLFYTVTVCLFVLPFSAYADAPGQPAPGTVAKYLMENVRIYDDAFKEIGRRPSSQLPPPGSSVLEIDSGMVKLQGGDSPVWVDQTSVELVPTTAVKGPVCSALVQAADQATSGVRGMGEKGPCPTQQKGGTK